MTAHCFFCGNVVGEEGCALCGTVRDTRDERRVRARCPRCGELARLTPFGLGDAALQACPRCKGMFVSALDWDTLLEVFSQVPLPDVLVPDAEGEPSVYGPYRSPPSSKNDVRVDLEADVRCPTCDRAMERIEFAAMTRVIIDVCPTHGVWLDAGELERIIESMHPHPRPEPIVHPPVQFAPLEPIPSPVDDALEPITVRNPLKDPFVARQPIPTAPVPASYARDRDVPWTVKLGRALGQLVRMIVAR